MIAAVTYPLCSYPQKPFLLASRFYNGRLLEVFWDCIDSVYGMMSDSKSSNQVNLKGLPAQLLPSHLDNAVQTLKSCRLIWTGDAITLNIPLLGGSGKGNSDQLDKYVEVEQRVSKVSKDETQRLEDIAWTHYKAEEFDQFIATFISIYGNKTSYILQLTVQVADHFFGKGDFASAIVWHQKARQRILEIYKDESGPFLVANENNVARAQNGANIKAQRHLRYSHPYDRISDFESYIKPYLTIIGSPTAYTIELTIMVAEHFSSKGDFSSAMTWHQKALDSSLRKYHDPENGQEHPTIALCKQNLTLAIQKAQA